MLVAVGGRRPCGGGEANVTEAVGGSDEGETNVTEAGGGSDKGEANVTGCR